MANQSVLASSPFWYLLSDYYSFSRYGTSSLTSCLLLVILFVSLVTVQKVKRFMICKICDICNIYECTRPLVSSGLAQQIMPYLSYPILQRQLSHLNGCTTVYIDWHETNKTLQTIAFSTSIVRISGGNFSCIKTFKEGRRGKYVGDMVDLGEWPVHSRTHWLHCTRVWVIQYTRFVNQCNLAYLLHVKSILLIGLCNSKW